MLALLCALAAAGAFQQGFSEVLPQIVISVSAAALTDLIINYIKRKKVILPLSAAISGMIIALVLNPGIKWHIPLIVSVIAIAQKHIIRYKGRHIFNPANFGLLTAIFVFGAYITWWGQSIWVLILLAGGLIAYRMKRPELPLIFTGVFILLLSFEALINKQPLIDSLFLVNLFFVFVMLIEPKTSPLTRKGRMIFGALAAALSFAAFKMYPQYDFSVLSLAVCNITVPFLNKIK